MNAETAPRIRVSAVVLATPDGRILTVRKRGTVRFMLPGGKPEPGESAAECAIRECREEVGLVLDPDRLVHLGRFVAPAANEDHHLVDSEVYVHPVPGDPVAAAEIVELRWLNPVGPLPDDLAPMLTGAVLPALRRR